MKKYDDPMDEFQHQMGTESNIQYRNRLRDQNSEEKNELPPIIESHFDTEEKTTELTLMEQLCLIDLGEERAQMSFLNDNIPYVLRACILLELVLAHRIKVNVHEGFSLEEPWKLNVTVSDFTPIGDPFLDEAIKILAKEKLSLQKWMDVLTGESWSRKLSALQMYNLRDRLCKSLMEKGVVTSQKSSLFLVETTEYPLQNFKLKRKLCYDIIDSVFVSEKFNARNLFLLLSLNAAKILHKALKISDAPTTSRVKAFATNSLARYSHFHNLEAKLGHLFDEGELYMIAGIFCLYEKLNKFF